jgi:hypothetical protein
MAVTPHDGSGTVFTFAGTGYTVTNIVITNNDPNVENTIDVSHLGLASGSSVLTQDRPLGGSATDTGQQVQVDYLGKVLVADGSTGTLVVTHNGTQLLSRGATVSSSTLTFALNDAVRGAATFRIARS